MERIIICDNRLSRHRRVTLARVQNEENLEEHYKTQRQMTGYLTLCAGRFLLLPQWWQQQNAL